MDFKRLPHFEPRHSRVLTFNERELFTAINELPLDEYIEVIFDSQKQAYSARNLLYSVYNKDEELLEQRGYGIGVYTDEKKPKSLMIARRPATHIIKRLKVGSDGHLIDRATGKVVEKKSGRREK